MRFLSELGNYVRYLIENWGHVISLCKCSILSRSKYKIQMDNQLFGICLTLQQVFYATHLTRNKELMSSGLRAQSVMY